MRWETELPGRSVGTHAAAHTVADDDDVFGVELAGLTVDSEFSVNIHERRFHNLF